MTDKRGSRASARKRASGSLKQRMAARLHERHPRGNSTRQRRTLRMYLERIRMVTGITAALGLGVIWCTGYGDRLTESAAQHAVLFAGRLGFSLEHIEVSGRERTPPGDLLEAIGIEQHQPLFKKSVEQIACDIKGLPWVKRVVIRRLLPNTLSVTLEERRPVAFWQCRHKYFYVDDQGIAIPVEDMKDLPQGLPLIVGQGAAEHVNTILGLIAQFPLTARKVTGRVFIRERRWDLLLEGGTTVHLPPKDTENALTILENAIGRLPLHAIEVIDLRVKGQMTARRRKGDTAA